MILALDITTWPHGLIYLAVYLFAIFEGEGFLIFACVLVGNGQLNPAGVLVAGALGGSTGDQFFFYALRGRVAAWLDRFPRLARRHDAIVARVQAHSTLMALACRFLPGLRVAIPAACAYAGVRPRKFSLLNLASAFAWAAAVMWLVAYGGPGLAARFGLKGWWAFLVPAALILVFFRWLGHTSRRMDRD